MDNECFDCKVPSVPVVDGYSVIYLITLDTWKQYVGQTVNFSSRMSNHKKGYKTKCIVDNFLRKHKWRVDIIGMYPIEEINDMEREYIKFLGTLHPYGYNIVEGGTEKVLWGEDARREISKRRYDKWKDEEYRSKVISAQIKSKSDPEFKLKQSEIMYDYYSKHPDTQKKLGKIYAHRWLEVHCDKKGCARYYIAQYDKNMNLIAVFNTLREASLVSGCHRYVISNVIKGKYKSSKGYYWKVIGID